MAKDHGPGIKDDEQYEKPREREESKQKAGGLPTLVVRQRQARWPVGAYEDMGGRHRPAAGRAFLRDER
jgi:hypothetical protein